MLGGGFICHVCTDSKSMGVVTRLRCVESCFAIRYTRLYDPYLQACAAENRKSGHALLVDTKSPDDRGL